MAARSLSPVVTSHCASALVHVLVIGWLATAAKTERWELSVQQGTPITLSWAATRPPEHPIVEIVDELEKDAHERESELSDLAEVTPQPVAVERQTVERPNDANLDLPEVETADRLAARPLPRQKSVDTIPPDRAAPPPPRTLATTPPEFPAVELPAEVAALAQAADPGATVEELPQKLPSNPAPDYPLEARLAGAEGRVLLAVRVAANGMVSSVRVRQSSGFRLLDRSAVEAVSRWRFVPGRRNGQAVEAEVLVPVRFSLRQG